MAEERRIYPGDPEYDGFRYRELWVYLTIDPADNQEGMIDGAQVTRWAMVNLPGPYPLLLPGPLFAADQTRVDDIDATVQAYAKAHDIQIRLVRLTKAEEVKTYG